MIYLISILSFATLFIIIFIGINVVMKEKMLVKQRLEKFVASGEKQNTGIEGSLTERILQPITKKIHGIINRVTPKHYYQQLEKKLQEAGNPMGMKAENIVFLQVSIFLLSVLMIMILWAIFKAPARKVILIAAMSFILVYIFPKLYIKQKIKQRQKDLEKSLPDVLDLLTVSIEAGLSFDGALAKLVEKMSGPLVDEFSIVLKEMRVGVSKRDAFKSMIDRVPSDSLITFAGAILQADQLGVSIGNVLRIQSAQMRQKRRQKAQESAMKAPVKMLFPMVFFILPTIFIVLLGPVVLKAIQIFGR